MCIRDRNLSGCMFLMNPKKVDLDKKDSSLRKILSSATRAGDSAATSEVMDLLDSLEADNITVQTTETLERVSGTPAAKPPTEADPEQKYASARESEEASSLKGQPGSDQGPSEVSQSISDDPPASSASIFDQTDSHRGSNAIQDLNEADFLSSASDIQLIQSMQSDMALSLQGEKVSSSVAAGGDLLGKRSRETGNEASQLDRDRASHRDRDRASLLLSLIHI